MPWGAEGWVHPRLVFPLPFRACPAQQHLCQMILMLLHPHRESSSVSSAASAPALPPWDGQGGAGGSPASAQVSTSHTPSHCPLWPCLCAVSPVLEDVSRQQLLSGALLRRLGPTGTASRLCSWCSRIARDPARGCAGGTGCP